MTESLLQSPHVVLCGPLRSGTTLLRLMLGQHSGIVGRNESDLLFDGLAEEGFDATDPDAYRHAVQSNVAFELMGLREPQGETARAIFVDLLRQHEPEGRRLLLTLHRHFEKAALVLPGAIFVRLRRDPRDVALSSVGMGWGGVPYFGVWPWIDAERSWRAALPHIAPHRRVEVSYDDLVNDPQATMRRILDAVGLPFEDAVLSPPADSTYSAPKPRERDAWRRKMSEREAAEINHRLRDYEEGSGYVLEPKRAPSRLRLAALWIRARVERLRWDFRRYGVAFALKQHYARRFGDAALRQQVAAERRRINRRHLQ